MQLQYALGMPNLGPISIGLGTRATVLNLVRNGAFNSGLYWDEIVNWNKGTISAGKISVTTVSYIGASQIISGLTIGQQYALKADIKTAGGRIYIGDTTTPNVSPILNTSYIGLGDNQSWVFTATATSHGLGISSSASEDTIEYDNISIVELVSNWIMDAGTWNDTGVWDDANIWKDA